MRRFWLALLTLLATLSSEPMGSVQQGAHDRVIPNSPPPALAVARTPADPAVAELLADIPLPEPPRITPPALCPYPVVGSFPARPPLPHLRAQSGCPDLPSLLERLPYDANAPPLPT